PQMLDRLPARERRPAGVDLVARAELEPRQRRPDDSWDEYRWISPRRPVLENALLWKGLYAEQYVHPASHRDFFTCVMAVGVITLIAAALIGFSQLSSGAATGLELLIRNLTLALTFILMLITALNSAGRLSRERERDTLGALLVLPVTSAEII